MSGEIQTVIVADELATLLIPMRGTQLVLPNVAVAEIIPYKAPAPVDDKPDWYLGTFSWRNIEVPLISFELINRDTIDETPQSDKRIAVLNGLVDSQQLPFCGIVTGGVPRLMRVSEGEVANDENSKVGFAELSRAIVGGEPAVIPNIELIQQQVLSAI